MFKHQDLTWNYCLATIWLFGIEESVSHMVSSCGGMADDRTKILTEFRRLCYSTKNRVLMKYQNVKTTSHSLYLTLQVSIWQSECIFLTYCCPSYSNYQENCVTPLTRPGLDYLRSWKLTNNLIDRKSVQTYWCCILLALYLVKCDNTLKD